MKARKSVPATQGKKMIVVEVRFHTTGLAAKKGHVLPKHAWVNGAMRVRPNQSHGIRTGKSRPFNSLLTITSVLEQLLKDHGIKLHAYETRTIAV